MGKKRGSSAWGIQVVCSFLLVAFSSANASDFDVTLEWDANTEADLAGYRIHYGPGSGSYTNVLDVGNVTSITLPALAEGAEYFFAVTAYNTNWAEGDFSNEISYTVPNSTNGPPTLDLINDVNLDEDSIAYTFSITGIGSGGSSGIQELAITAISDNPALIPDPHVQYVSPDATGTLTIVPMFNANGTANITVTIDNGAATNHLTSRRFTVNVIPVNDQPTVDSIDDLVMVEDAPTKVISITGISSGATNEPQTLLVQAVSDNPAVVPNPAIQYSSPDATGTLTISPVPDAYGIARITVTVDDGGATNHFVSHTFSVTVNALNDPPTIDPIADVIIDEDAPAETISFSGITTGASNEEDTLQITAVSDDPAIIPNPSVIYNNADSIGTLSFAPATNANGVATITVTVDDGRSQNNVVTRRFEVSVGALNDPPGLAPINDITVVSDGNPKIVSLTGLHSGVTNEDQTLTITAISSDPGRVPNPVVTYDNPNSSGTLTFTPVAGGGTVTITVTVDDGAASNNITSRSFEITVQSLNEPPTISPIEDITIFKNQSSGLIAFTVGDRETTATNLVLSARTSNTNLISTNRIRFGGSESNRTVRLIGEKGRTGTALITILVNDGGLQSSTTFQLTVLNATKTSADSEPVILSIAAVPQAGISIQWSSTAGEVYQVVYKDDLNDPVWQDLSPDVFADGAVTTWMDSSMPLHRSRYYSVIMIQPQATITEQ